MLRNLSTKKYQSRDKNPALLLHSTGHYPADDEIDASIIYADYYYIEALMRWKKIRAGQSLSEANKFMHPGPSLPTMVAARFHGKGELIGPSERGYKKRNQDRQQILCSLNEIA